MRIKRYLSDLREYKALKGLLGPWISAFHKIYSRQPTSADVDSTDINWLIKNFTRYQILRERVLVYTRNLRSILAQQNPYVQEQANFVNSGPSPRLNINRIQLDQHPQPVDPDLESQLEKIDLKERFYEKRGELVSLEAEQAEREFLGLRPRAERGAAQGEIDPLVPKRKYEESVFNTLFTEEQLPFYCVIDNQTELKFFQRSGEGAGPPA